jgi:hypothetical protein
VVAWIGCQLGVWAARYGTTAYHFHWNCRSRRWLTHWARGRSRDTLWVDGGGMNRGAE